MSTHSVVASDLLSDFEIVRTAVERTVRLVSTARLRAPVLADLVPSEMMDDLYEIESATSGRLVGETRGHEGIDPNEFVFGVPHAHFINASFAYPRPGALNRFNGPYRGAWYAALVVETCLAEVKFHIGRELTAIGEFTTRVEYAEMFASFAGEFLDLRAGNKEHPCLHSDGKIAYPIGNSVADAARQKGINLIVYPSIRHQDGTCFAALSPHAVQSVAQGGVWCLEWHGDPEPVVSAIAA